MRLGITSDPQGLFYFFLAITIIYLVLFSSKDLKLMKIIADYQLRRILANHV